MKTTALFCDVLDVLGGCGNSQDDQSTKQVFNSREVCWGGTSGKLQEESHSETSRINPLSVAK